MSDERETGVLVRWDAWKGYGFLRSLTRRDTDDIFLHASECGNRTPLAGERLGFRRVETPKGDRAVDIVFLAEEDPRDAWVHGAKAFGSPLPRKTETETQATQRGALRAMTSEGR
jgi:cold shock CspA family protein